MVTVSLKPIGAPPGDASADQMDAVADLAEDYAHDEIRVSHEQNLILPHVALDDLPAVYDRLASVGLATPNAGQISDIIACPGLDYCALATARSIPVAERIAKTFGDGAKAKAIGPLKIKISGCINACGHHHVGHIGILGLERAGESRPTRSRSAARATRTRRSAISSVPASATRTWSGRSRRSSRPTWASGPTRPRPFWTRSAGWASTPFKEALYERSAGSDI